MEITEYLGCGCGYEEITTTATSYTPLVVMVKNTNCKARVASVAKEVNGNMAKGREKQRGSRMR
jgi:hypothetical protein